MAGSAFKLPKARTSGAPYFSRNQVAAVLHQVAVLLELKGECLPSPFVSKWKSNDWNDNRRLA